ncbi:MAG: alanine racemase [Magnetospiraceae bacterium]
MDLNGHLDRHGAVLSIDLRAVVGNWWVLNGIAGPGRGCAAVVKADAYGVGLAPVARALWQAGCQDFFVALLEEGLALREILPNAAIYVLTGANAATVDIFARYRLKPVLNTPNQINVWLIACQAQGEKLPAAIHVDTGMNRLGLAMGEAEALAQEGRDALRTMGIDLVMSHLACAEDRGHPKNQEQLAAFQDIRRRLPMGRASFANSSGIFLGPDFGFDLFRPGVALYGINPTPDRENPMAPVVRLQAKIIQVREVDSAMTVGYGATHVVAEKGRIATIAVGYADGYLRSLSSSGTVYIGDVPVPVVGRVSMDLVTLDVSHLPENQVRPGTVVDVIGPHNPADAVAAAAGTIGYEILTSLGARYYRHYEGSAS